MALVCPVFLSTCHIPVILHVPSIFSPYNSTVKEVWSSPTYQGPSYTLPGVPPSSVSSFTPFDMDTDCMAPSLHRDGLSEYILSLMSTENIISKMDDLTSVGTACHVPSFLSSWCADLVRIKQSV